MQDQFGLNMAPVVTFDDDDSLPVSLASVRKRLSMSDVQRDHDDQLTEQILEITEKLETEVESYLRPATVVEYYDETFGHRSNTMYYNVGMGHWLYAEMPPWDYPFKKYPVLESPTPPVFEYLPDDGDGSTYSTFSDYDLALEAVPSKVRIIESLPNVYKSPKAWRITYRSYYQRVPMIAKRAIIQKVVDEFQNRGLDTGKDDLIWQKAVASLTWGPL